VGWSYDGATFTAPVVVSEPAPTDDDTYSRSIQVDKVLKAVVLSINDGTLVPGANVSNAALKAIVKANM
jgi:hypothetical protein